MMASLLVPLTFAGFAGCFGGGIAFLMGRPPLHAMSTPVSVPVRRMVEPLGALTGYIVALCTRCGSSYLPVRVGALSQLVVVVWTHLSCVVLPLVVTMGFMLASHMHMQLERAMRKLMSQVGAFLPGATMSRSCIVVVEIVS